MAQTGRKNRMQIGFSVMMLCLLPFVLSLYVTDITYYPLCAYSVMSFVSFTAYYMDKKRAEKGGWRIPEINLHCFELLGGWPGALLGQRIFRHKTLKKPYQAVFRLIVTVHMAAWADCLVFNLFLFRQIREIMGRII